ncbi:MAG TPA: lamin tail domain-containing protein [Pyrinomonadaceae bacterium]|jgi:hypothetical protein|nr:lamin tail domain-containing protein [Pyrinomonadaceae bacterium]
MRKIWLHAAACALVLACAASASAQTLIISEFRWSGTNGASDEFVEIYNNSDSEVNVLTTDGSAGYAVAKSPGTTLFYIPNGTKIPPRAHYLGCNSTPSVGYSLFGYPAGNGTTAICDATYTGADALPLNTGIALFKTANPANFTTANRLDAVGTTSETNTLFKEGDGVYPLTTLTTNNSYFRSERYGLPFDTGDNGADFIWADTDGNCAIDPPGTTCIALDGTRRGRHIGSPGPENSSSPIVRNTTAPATLLAPCVSNTVAPNRMRTTASVTNGFNGTIAFRRTITNTSTSTITRLRFRLVDLSIFPDGNYSGSPNADLRAMTSSVSTEPNPCGGGSLTIQGLRLEEASPLAPNNQPNGGGFNSTLSADGITTITPLRPGDTLNVSFLFGIQSKGNARFWFNIEMLP